MDLLLIRIGQAPVRVYLTCPNAFSSIILCSMLATSLRVNTVASGLIETELSLNSYFLQGKA
ncbi:MAG: hypothetical protein JTT17_04735 [Candidatus Brockarchaeota archaeon]|nr:hypothetical protein [Candidatus Brockarchaeota archaeon]